MTDRNGEAKDLRVLYGAAALLVLALFLFSVRPVLSPIVLFLALLLLLLPWAGTRPYNLLVTGAGLLTLLWLLETTGSLLAPFLLALGLAYILDPAVDALERRRVPRSLAVLLLGLPAVLLLVVAGVFGIPALVDQIEELIERAPELVRRLSVWAESARTSLLRVELPGAEGQALFGGLRDLDPEEIQAYLSQRQEQVARQIWAGVLGLGKGVGTVLTILGYVVLTPVLTFYLLRDYDRLAAHAAGLVPHDRRPAVYAFVSEYNRLLSRFLRGQVVAAAIVGVLTWLGLWVLGFPFSGLVGAVAGIFNLVPYLGLVVSLIPALVIALLSGNLLASLLKVAGVFVVVQFIDGSVTGPRIVGGSVGLHPVWVILSIALAGFFFGFVGLLIAVPLAVLLKLLLVRGLERYRASASFRGAVAAE